MTIAFFLALLINGKNFIMFFDASLYGLGAVLIQYRNVISYTLSQLRPHEKNYLTHDVDLATVVFILKIERQNHYGVKCGVLTDHHTLQYVVTQKNLNLK